MRPGLALILCVFSLLAGCGGGDGGTTPPPTSNNPPPPPPPPPPPVIGAAGGTVTETSGASVIVPAGAIDADTTIRVAMDSTGAPPLPQGMVSAGSTYVITPHGGNFKQPVKVRIPLPTVALQPNQEFKLAKAQPGGAWVVLGDSTVADGKLSADVTSFSFFMSVVITYPLPIFQAVPFEATATLDCGEPGCSGRLLSATATYTVTTNHGQIPANCAQSSLAMYSTEYDYSALAPPHAMTIDGGSFTETVNQTDPWTPRQNYYVTLSCTGPGIFGPETTVINMLARKSITWAGPPLNQDLAVMRMPAQVDVVEGMTTNLDVIMGGGAGGLSGPAVSTTNRAVVDWQRSDDGGASWRVVARSYQGEGNPIAFGNVWFGTLWSVRYGLAGSAADQGGLIRVHACYTAPSGPAHPCVFSTATRLNLLQQSGVPVIVNSPRSLLVRTGQTASLAASATGLPAPVLQWQTRPANSNGAWSNVTSGTGAVTANYTTAATALADNGTQYRVLATNALGSTASTAVTVSVSDLDVAPTITTQPASLSVASGGDAVFAIDARGTEALSYQWYRNGSALAGANSPVLRLSGVSILNSGSFTVTVSNSAGDADSNAATLNVYPGTPAAVAPTIVTQPASLTVNAGNTATFAVGVDGTGPFTFQWRRNGINIPGTNSAVLSLPSVVSDASGQYSVVVSNSVGPGVTSTAASLSVSSIASAEAPMIVTHPSTIVVAPGGSAVLAVAASGTGPLSYQWSRDGVHVPGETGAVLILPEIDEDDVGEYTVTVRNALGTVESQSASVILLGAPVLWSGPSDIHTFENSTTTFRVEAGGPHLHYQWLRNGLPIGSSDAYSYTTPSLTLADSGAVYSVIVYNGAGIALSGPAVLTVTAPVPPTILQQPADVSVQAGQFANLCMAFGGTPPFSVQMNRWDGTQWVPTSGRFPINDNAAFCTITPILQLADNGARFIFFASNAEGGIWEAMTRQVTVTVTAPPAITTTTLASRATNGATANNRSGAPSLSADGNIVAFISDGTNLVPGFIGSPFTSNNAYVRNLTTGVTTQINVTPAGTQSMYGVNGLKLAAGGRYAIFTSLAGDLVADDTNGSQDVFVRDLEAGITRRVSLRADGTELEFFGNGQSDMQVNISADGRFVSFVSSQDLIGDDPSGAYSLYFRSLQTGFLRRVFSSTTHLVSYSTLSDNGEHLAYLKATFLPGNTYNTIVHYDTEANSSDEVFSIDSTNNASYVAQGIGISGNGQYVTFSVYSPSTFNGSAFRQIVAIDRNRPSIITVASGGSFGFGDGTSIWPKVSDDGHVLFETNAPNLTNNFTNSQIAALVVRDLQTSEVTVASRRPNGTTIAPLAGYAYHAISSDGTVVAFVADEFDMSGGGMHGPQVYVASRP